jgi:hypothetical protein
VRIPDFVFRDVACVPSREALRPEADRTQCGDFDDSGPDGMESLRSDARAVAFVLRAMDSRNQQCLDFDETNLPMLNDSPLYLLTDLRVIGRIEGLRPLGACKPGDDTQQEFVDFAEPFRTSPESCVKTLIEFAQYHRSQKIENTAISDALMLIKEVKCDILRCVDDHLLSLDKLC